MLIRSPKQHVVRADGVLAISTLFTQQIGYEPGDAVDAVYNTDTKQLIITASDEKIAPKVNDVSKR